MYYLVAYSSITFANGIKNYFKHDGDYIGVVHTPSELTKGGCSYSIKIKLNKLQQVINVSKEFGFKIKGIFQQLEDGRYIEVVL